jgi:hypothetical protein
MLWAPASLVVRHRLLSTTVVTSFSSGLVASPCHQQSLQHVALRAIQKEIGSGTNPSRCHCTALHCDADADFHSTAAPYAGPTATGGTSLYRWPRRVRHPQPYLGRQQQATKHGRPPRSRGPVRYGCHWSDGRTQAAVARQQAGLLSVLGTLKYS